jgi:hypothetical protein
MRKTIIAISLGLTAFTVAACGGAGSSSAPLESPTLAPIESPAESMAPIESPAESMPTTESPSDTASPAAS